MAITEIEITDHLIFKNQVFRPFSGLNIITSNNGGGKTKLLEYISYTYRDRFNIKSLLTSIHNFKDYTSIDDYISKKSMRPPQAMQFKEEYNVLAKLPNNPSMIKACNAFFEKLQLKIRLYDNMISAGTLYFQSRGIQKAIPMNQISTGEKTAFILWLITQSDVKPDVLLLDEFDSCMDQNVLTELHNILRNIEGVQTFMTTHRSYGLATVDGWIDITDGGFVKGGPKN